MAGATEVGSIRTALSLMVSLVLVHVFYMMRLFSPYRFANLILWVDVKSFSVSDI